MASDRPKKPHGTFTSASTIGRVLTRGGFPAFAVRKGVGYGGHRCSWDKINKVVRVGYRCGDDTPDDRQDSERREMLGLYAQLLESKGYDVRRSFGTLYVDPERNPAMDNPKPTLAEQIRALAWLRKGWDGDNSERAIEAFNTLDNADLFADLDQARDAAENRNRIRKELEAFAHARHIALEAGDITFSEGVPLIDGIPADQWLEALTEERPEVTWT